MFLTPASSLLGDMLWEPRCKGLLTSEQIQVNWPVAKKLHDSQAGIQFHCQCLCCMWERKCTLRTIFFALSPCWCKLSPYYGCPSHWPTLEDFCIRRCKDISWQSASVGPLMQLWTTPGTRQIADRIGCDIVIMRTSSMIDLCAEEGHIHVAIKTSTKMTVNKVENVRTGAIRLESVCHVLDQAQNNWDGSHHGAFTDTKMVGSTRCLENFLDTLRVLDLSMAIFLSR